MKKLAVPIPGMCDLVGCSRSLAYDLIHRGEVVAVKLGRKTVITVASIEAMIERNAVGHPARDCVGGHDHQTVSASSGGGVGALCRLTCNSAKQHLTDAGDLVPCRG